MSLHISKWKPEWRPGFFGSRKKQKIQEINDAFGEGNWTLGWVVENPHATDVFEFEEACKHVYEESYSRFFGKYPEELEFVCSFSEVIDNAMSNIQSGLDYTIQEARGTHIQDIAIRNCLRRVGRHFSEPRFPSSLQDKILTVRGHDSNGHRFNPGQVPLMDGIRIIQPSMAPEWAKPGSVEDFWQSNKYIFSRIDD